MLSSRKIERRPTSQSPAGAQPQLMRSWNRQQTKMSKLPKVRIKFPQRKPTKMNLQTKRRKRARSSLTETSETRKTLPVRSNKMTSSKPGMVLMTRLKRIHRLVLMELKPPRKRTQPPTSSLEDPGPSLEEAPKESSAVNSARVSTTLMTMAMSRRKPRSHCQETTVVQLPMELGNSSTCPHQPKLVDREILRRRS